MMVACSVEELTPSNRGYWCEGREMVAANDKLLTTEELAELLAVSIRTVRRLVASGSFPIIVFLASAEVQGC